MTLEGANVFFDTTDYGIYAMNSLTAGQYCVVLPKTSTVTHNMLVDLHMKSAFDSVTNGSKQKEQLIEEIKNEYEGVKSKYNEAILVIPMIDENVYATAVINNDKQKMFDNVKKIGAITSEIYKKLTESGSDKPKIDQKIIMIIKNNDDIKFVDWLKEQMPNFVIGVNLSELQASKMVNPFISENPIPPVGINDIFATSTENVTEVPQSTNQTNVEVVTNPQESVSAPVVEPQTEIAPAIDQAVPQSVSEVAQPSVSVPPVGEVQQQEVIQTPAVQAVQQPQPTAQASVEPTPPSVQPTEVAPASPQPVQSTPLEATTTIPVQPTGEVAPSGETGTSIPESKGSKGFTNLLILLAVLAVVTFVSIELGKFLYNTYGV